MPRRRKIGFLAAALISASVAAVVVASCGQETTFTAEGFVTEMNDHGAALALGPPLTSNADGAEVFTVTITDAAPSVTGEEFPNDSSHGAATLLILEETGSAEDEFTRCERAADLTCFRAANAVLRVQGLEGADQARISTALQGIAAGD